MTADLERVFRAAGGRVRAALAARFRNLDLAEDAFADACLAAVEAWAQSPPRDAAAWLYATATRRGLDRLRRRAVRDRAPADAAAPAPTPEEVLVADERLIPDERLRLIFVCCHPAIAPDARAALTLRMVCGLSTAEIAKAFLAPEPTLAQRLVRAKRKIAEAGVPFETPGPDAWPERMDAVLSTLEVAYAKAYEDAAGAGAHAVYAEETLRLTGLLVELAPSEPEALGLAALVRFAEARRPARLDDTGAMVPVSEQDPSLWRRDRIAEGESLLRRAEACARPGPRQLQAAIHAAHCARLTLGRTPWRAILRLYDELVRFRPDAVVRLNRTAALAEIAGAEIASAELAAVAADLPQDWPPLLALRADLALKLGRAEEARAAFEALLVTGPPPAERLWLERRRAETIR